MQMRNLGSQGLMVSELGLGCMAMSEFYGTPDEDESIATIHRAIELGVTFLDTADMYGPFTNERLVGRAIADRRDQVTLATKFGNERTEDGTRLGVNGRPEYVRQQCEVTPDDLTRIDEVAPKGAAAGTRYPEAMMRLVNVQAAGLERAPRSGGFVSPLNRTMN